MILIVGIVNVIARTGAGKRPGCDDLLWLACMFLNCCLLSRSTVRLQIQGLGAKLYGIHYSTNTPCVR